MPNYKLYVAFRGFLHGLEFESDECDSIRGHLDYISGVPGGSCVVGCGRCGKQAVLVPVVPPDVCIPD
jgi:hypothetical protein